MAKIRVMIVDDHAVLRAGLQLLIDTQQDMVVVAEAGSMHAALELLGHAAADVVVMDVSLPDGDGVLLTQRMLQQYPQLRILALTWYKEQGYLRRMVAAGACGYVVKQSAADSLLNAIRAVAAGETYLDPIMNPEQAPQPQPDNSTAQKAMRVSETAPGTLTADETAVLQLVAWGYSNREIAEQRGMPLVKVTEHKARAMQKLGLQSRIDVLRYAEARGWKREEPG